MHNRGITQAGSKRHKGVEHLHNGPLCLCLLLSTSPSDVPILISLHSARIVAIPPSPGHDVAQLLKPIRHPRDSSRRNNAVLSTDLRRHSRPVHRAPQTPFYYTWTIWTPLFRFRALNSDDSISFRQISKGESTSKFRYFNKRNILHAGFY